MSQQPININRDSDTPLDTCRKKSISSVRYFSANIQII